MSENTNGIRMMLLPTLDGSVQSRIERETMLEKLKGIEPNLVIVDEYMGEGGGQVQDLMTALAAVHAGVAVDDIKPLPMQADVLKAVCDHIIHGTAKGRRPKEIRLGDQQWEKFTEQCDLRLIMKTRIVHVLKPSAFEVIA